jgi:hypothetical protein
MNLQRYALLIAAVAFLVTAIMGFLQAIGWKSEGNIEQMQVWIVFGVVLSLFAIGSTIVALVGADFR